jgi:hypothetical protein
MEKILGDGDVIQSFSNILDKLQSLFEDEISFSLTDLEKFIKFAPSEHMFPFANVGDPIPKDDILMKAIEEDKTYTIITDRCTTGFNIKVVAIPLKNKQGKIVGGLSFGRSLKNSSDIMELSKDLVQSTEQITKTIQVINDHARNITETNNDIQERIHETLEESKKTDGIISIVSKIATDTNLLGLNAAIEAAKGGESGKGFSVVASEIRKLSATSKNSINEINLTLNTIKNSITKIEKDISIATESSKIQADAIFKVTESIQSLRESTKILENLANKL